MSNNIAQPKVDTAYEKQLQEALQFHNSGALEQAKGIYERLHAGDPGRLDVAHNLGAVLLGLGELKRGVELVAGALRTAPEHEGMQGSARMLGMELVKHNFWEQAQPWLLDALQIDPDDQEVSQTLQRISARSYLAPEIFDPLAQQTVRRYSPREAGDYVYTIDIVGTCNLRCPTCPVGNFDATGRSRKMMPLDVFEQVLEKITRETPCKTAQIWLYNWGEPLLHPKLPAMIGLIREAGFRSYLSSNLNIEKGLKEVIKAAPDDLKISLSGITPDTYNTTHSGGDINLVKSNLYRLRKYLDHYQSATRVWVGHHLYKNNYAQQEAVQALCEELGFEHRPMQAFYQPLEKLIRLAEGDAEIAAEPIMSNLIVPLPQQLEFAKQHAQPDYDCELRFNQTIINADATVALCCSQYHSENMLGMNFLDAGHAEIEARKYQNPLCGSCRKHGLDYSPISIPETLNAPAS